MNGGGVKYPVQFLLHRGRNWKMLLGVDVKYPVQFVLSLGGDWETPLAPPFLPPFRTHAGYKQLVHHFSSPLHSCRI